MRLLIAIVLLLPTIASAEVLVRHCDTPTATACAVPSIWVRPASAINVQVQRTGAPFVRVADVLPNERIAVCVDDAAVAPGSSTTCSTRVPGRNDLWQLKSIVFADPVTTGQITLLWNVVTTDEHGEPFADIAGYVVNRQPDWCSETSADPRCGTAIWTTEDVVNVTSKVFTGLAGRWCFTVQAYTSGRELGGITELPACATPGQIKRLPGAVSNVRATGP
jgi:hypothetical protein